MSLALGTCLGRQASQEPLLRAERSSRPGHTLRRSFSRLLEGGAFAALTPPWKPGERAPRKFMESSAKDHLGFCLLNLNLGKANVKATPAFGGAGFQQLTPRETRWAAEATAVLRRGLRDSGRTRPLIHRLHLLCPEKLSSPRADPGSPGRLGKCFQKASHPGPPRPRLDVSSAVTCH